MNTHDDIATIATLLSYASKPSTEKRKQHCLWVCIFPCLPWADHHVAERVHRIEGAERVVDRCCYRSPSPRRELNQDLHIHQFPAVFFHNAKRDHIPSTSMVRMVRSKASSYLAVQRKRTSHWNHCLPHCSDLCGETCVACVRGGSWNSLSMPK